MRKGARGGLSRSQREWAVNSLSCFGPEVSKRQLASIGAEVGRSLLRSAKDFAASREPIYESPQDNYPGRKRLKNAAGVASDWVAAPSTLSRTNKSGENLRAVHGGKPKVAAAIQEKFGCSRATAYG